MYDTHRIASLIWYHIIIYYIVNVEAGSIMSAIYVPVRQTMPRSLRYAALRVSMIGGGLRRQLPCTHAAHLVGVAAARGEFEMGAKISFPAKYNGVAHTNSL